MRQLLWIWKVPVTDGLVCAGAEQLKGLPDNSRHLEAGASTQLLVVGQSRQQPAPQLAVVEIALSASRTNQ